MKDLALLVADKNMDFAMRGILTRNMSLGIRVISFETEIHPGRDGGVRTTGPETLALLKDQFYHGMIMLDWEGSGSDADRASILERELDSRLSRSWGDRAKAIVIEPELDAWVWGADNAMGGVLGWSEALGIRRWLTARGYRFDREKKPLRPKEALEELMVQLGQPSPRHSTRR